MYVPQLEFILLFLGGILIGVSDAVVGSGSLFMVSALTLTGIPPLNSIATMRLTTVCEEFVGTLAYWRKKLVHWKLSLLLGIFAILGGYIGANLVLDIDEKTLSSIVGVLMLFLLLFIPRIREEKEVIFPLRLIKRFLFREEPSIFHQRKKMVLLAILTLVLGVYGGFYGASFGTMLFVAFAVVGQKKFLTSAANVKVISFLMSLSASYVFLTSDSPIVWEAFVPLVSGSIIGTILGVNWAEKLEYKFIKPLLYAVVIAAAVRLLVFQ